MPDWLVNLLMVWAFAWGFVCAWCACHQHDPFWRGFQDGLSFRFLWDRRRRD